MPSREGAGAAFLRRAHLAAFLPGSTRVAGELVSRRGRLEAAVAGSSGRATEGSRSPPDSVEYREEGA
jgi:hypothetical protein